MEVATVVWSIFILEKISPPLDLESGQQRYCGKRGQICSRFKKKIIVSGGRRDHICHKQYKQRLCKIIITQVKVHFVDVF